MKPVTETYRHGWMSQRRKLIWRAPHVCGAVKEILKPLSVVDVGCATGDLVRQFNKMGIPAMGIEGSKHCLEFLECTRGDIVIQDLREPFELAHRFDVATCFEVAEHIEPEYAHVFVRNLVNMSDQLLLSINEQEGRYHVNCQPMSYWEPMFLEYDYARDKAVPELFRKRWKAYRHRDGIKAYYRNIVFFRKKDQ